MAALLKKSDKLHKAAQAADIPLMKKLIDKGSDVNGTDAKGATPLFYTAATGSVEAARLLLEHGADINHRAFGGGIVLHSAILTMQDDLSLFLIENGINIHQATEAGVTPLHLAANIMRKKVVQKLIEKGADVNAATIGARQTPLLLAVVAFAGSLHGPAQLPGKKTIQMLLEAGADISVTAISPQGGEVTLAQCASLHPKAKETLHDLLCKFQSKVTDEKEKAAFEQAINELYEPAYAAAKAKAESPQVEKKQEAESLPQKQAVLTAESAAEMGVAGKYLLAIQAAYSTHGIDFFSLVHGAQKSELEELKEAYPDIPQALLHILAYVDGTYFREYNGKKVNFYMFDGALYYYLNSVKQMLKLRSAKRNIEDIYGGEYAVEVTGRGIDMLAPFSKRLHISDCMNNGGSSQLLIDFSPAEDGVSGQVIRWMHDPDEYTVIADSFEQFLQDQLDNGFKFIEDYKDLSSYKEQQERWEKLQPFYADLRNNHPGALHYLKNNLREHHILGVANVAPSSGVLNIYLEEMRRLYFIRTESTPEGYTYADQYSYLLRNFIDLHEKWKKHELLAQQVLNFAREVNNLELLLLFKDTVALDEFKSIINANCTREQVQNFYIKLAPADFFELFQDLYNTPNFKEYILSNFTRLPRYKADSPRQRVLKLDARWQKLFAGDADYFIPLCDLAANEADIATLKNMLSREQPDVGLSAWFGHALCLMGEDYIEREYDYICDLLLTGLKYSDNEYFIELDCKYGDLHRAIDQLQDGADSEVVYDFSFILSLRPHKAAMLVKKMAELTDNAADKKTAEQLIAILNKK